MLVECNIFRKICGLWSLCITFVGVTGRMAYLQNFTKSFCVSFKLKSSKKSLSKDGILNSAKYVCDNNYSLFPYIYSFILLSNFHIFFFFPLFLLIVFCLAFFILLFSFFAFYHLPFTICTFCQFVSPTSSFRIRTDAILFSEVTSDIFPELSNHVECVLRFHFESSPS